MNIQSVINSFHNENMNSISTIDKLYRLIKGIIFLNPNALWIFFIYCIVVFMLRASKDVDFLQKKFGVIVWLFELVFSVNNLVDFISLVFTMVVAGFYKLKKSDSVMLSAYISQTSYLYDNNFIEDLYNCISDACVFIYRFLIFISMSLIFILRAICVLYSIVFCGDNNIQGVSKKLLKKLLVMKFIMLIIYSIFPILNITYFCYMILKKNSISQQLTPLSQASRNKIKGFKKYKTYISIKNLEELQGFVVLFFKIFFINLVACILIRFVRNKICEGLCKNVTRDVNAPKLISDIFSGITASIIMLPFGLGDVMNSIGSFNNLFVSFDIFSFVFDAKCVNRPHLTQINKLKLKINKYYIVTIPDNLIQTIEDKYFVMKFSKLINNDYDQVMELMRSYPNKTITNYISNELSKADNLLFDDVELELVRDYVKIKHNGYYYTFNINKTMFIRLFGDSGSGKSTISEILGGYIIHNDSTVTGISDGREITTSISNMSDDSKSGIAEYKNTRDVFMIGNSTGRDNYNMACDKFQQIEEDTHYFEDLNIEKYKYMLDIPYKYWITSSGQEAKLLFLKTLLEATRDNSFLTISDELLANIGKADQEKIMKIFMDHVSKLNKKTTAIFTDHSNVIEELGWYDLKISIENKKLVPNMKNKDGKYVKIDTFFTKGVNSVEINGIKVTREEIS